MNLSAVIIDWCCLVPQHERFVQAALEELAERIPCRYPQLPRIELSGLSASDRLQLPEFVEYHLNESCCIPGKLSPLARKLPFVFCVGNEPFAMKVRKLKPAAKWGIAMFGYFALAWHPDNRFLIWHEAMHLLYAEDCYDRENGDPCDESYCLMQYEPCERNCGGDLYLCKHNISEITTCREKLKKRSAGPLVD